MQPAMQRPRATGMPRGRRGQSLVELGIALPLLLLLMAGVVDLAHVFSVAGILQNAAREGARWGATFHPTDSASIDDIKNRVIQEAAGSPLTLDASEIHVDPDSGVANSGAPVTITVTHQVDLLLTQALSLPSLTIVRSASMVMF
jgi:Flp pilus assembly protein TadG